MSAIKFIATIENGMIKIPAEYQQDLNNLDRVEVIVVSERKTAKTGIIADLIENPIIVEDFKLLTREEAHDRKL